MGWQWVRLNYVSILGALYCKKLKLDDHSEADPLLPIPNRTVKHLSADDSADSRAKVGHHQAH